MRLLPLVFLTAALAGCGDNIPGAVYVYTTAELAPILRDMAAFTDDRIVVDVRAAEDLLLPTDAFAITVRQDASLQSGDQGYRVELVDANPKNPQVGQQVIGGGLLGAQYGFAHALENLGFRFRHPFETYQPKTLALTEPVANFPLLGAPAVEKVRGLQLHTLHPIEAYHAVWQPSPQGLYEAKRIVDWIVKNRGNYVQWAGLDNILEDGQYAPWLAHTRAINDFAHARGMTTGIGLQIFGSGNLQGAFDLVDDPEGSFEDQVAARLPLLVDADFDTYGLSFGEFFGEDPQALIDAINQTLEAILVLDPAARVTSSIHVGADQRVDFGGETNLIYYFLVKFADPRIVPDVHTVMYYPLEDAADAYHHVDFLEHEDYLLDRLRAGLSATFYPETAYWVAFDNSVPMYLPLYVRNRWSDLARLSAATTAEGIMPLDGHVLFSTGWEWGYWLHDYTALRASYTLPSDYGALIEQAFAGDLGPSAAALTRRVSELQHQALVTDRLGAYVQGRDVIIDAGDEIGINSQPDRLLFAEIGALDATARAAFTTDVVVPLEAYAVAMAALAAEGQALALPSSRWVDEWKQGLAVSARRAEFAAASYRAAVAHLDGDSARAATARQAMTPAFDAGLALVRARHADLHVDNTQQTIGRTVNDTVYQYGYLFMPDSLCFWRREIGQLDNLMQGTNVLPPDCYF